VAQHSSRIKVNSLKCKHKTEEHFSNILLRFCKYENAGAILIHLTATIMYSKAKGKTQITGPRDRQKIQAEIKAAKKNKGTK